MIAVQTYVPAALGRFIKSFWCLQVTGAAGMPYEEDIVPDGHHEIIFHIDAAAKRKTGTGEWQAEPRAFIAGQHLQSYTLQLNPGSMLYGIRFHPHTVALFFDFPATALTNNLLALDALPGTDAWLHCLSPHPATTFARLEQLFMKKAAAQGWLSNSFHYMEAAVSDILAQRGAVKIDALIEKTGLSVKHLDNLFKRYVGVNPKMLCHIIRLNYFIHYRKSHPLTTLTECAYEAGFYDQSHLIKLFTAFTGKSPRRYFGETNDISSRFAAM